MTSHTKPGPLFKPPREGLGATNPDFSQKSLLKAAGEGSVEWVKDLCEGGVWSVKQQSWGNEQWGRKEYNLDLNGLDSQDRVTPLIRAANLNRLEVVELLLKQAANPNLRNRTNESALHRAALHGYVDVCQVLLKNRADPTAEDITLRTPLDVAEINNHPEVVAMLRDIRQPIRRSYQSWPHTVGVINLRGGMREIPRQRYRRKYHKYGWQYQHGSVEPLPRIFDSFDQNLALTRNWSDSALPDRSLTAAFSKTASAASQTMQRSGPI
jgi:hypothetical protein